MPKEGQTQVKKPQYLRERDQLPRTGGKSMRRLFAVPGIRRMMCVFAALVMICGCMVSFASAEGTELALEG